MISSPFQCDYCWFINVCKRVPNEDLISDAQLMCYIRRVNLDMFWSREPSTVNTTFQSLNKAKLMSEKLGLPPVSVKMGPWPIGDALGFQICLEILRASKLPGKHSKTYSQFDTIRKLRTAYINCIECEPSRVLNMRSLKTDRGQHLTQTDSPTQSLLFRMFMRGCEKRMGRYVKQNIGLSLVLLLEILRRYEIDLAKDNITYQQKRMKVICGSAFVMLWAGALRGGEILLLEASELVRRRDQGRHVGKGKDVMGHVVIPLMGRFKGETGERNLILVLVNVTDSGLEIRKWVDRLTALLAFEQRNLVIGPAICDSQGAVLSLRDLNLEFHKVLGEIQKEKSELLPPDVEIAEHYNVYRSFRRGATTRAQEQKVPSSVIEMNNRWRKVQNNQGNLPRLPMNQLYLEITQIMKTKLLFSKSL